jgi:hypothetical protein
MRESQKMTLEIKNQAIKKKDKKIDIKMNVTMLRDRKKISKNH